MRALISSMLAFILLLHAALGCCWHCACIVKNGMHANCKASSSCSCCRAGKKHEEKSQTPSPCKCKKDCGLAVYIPTQKTVLDSQDFVFCSMLVAHVGHADDYAVNGYSHNHFQECVHWSGPSADLQLLYQVFVI